MNVKKTTGAYNDCYAVMDQMLKRGGGKAEFESYKKATVFRHRCYRARNLLYKASEKASYLGAVPSTPYDDLFLVLEKDNRVIEFKLRSKQDLPALSFPDTPQSTLDFDI